MTMTLLIVSLWGKEEVLLASQLPSRTKPLPILQPQATCSLTHVKIHSRLHVLSNINHEYFVAKIFLDSLACAKIKHTEFMHIIVGNAVRGHLSENYEILLHKISWT